MKICIASDHRGFKMKKALIKYLTKKNHVMIDFGTDSKEPIDYPKLAFEVGECVVKKEAELGIVICGTGIGMSIACNKVKGVRCAKIDTLREAKLTRMDNDANVVSLSAKMPLYHAKDILDVFLKTPFSKQDRHIRRIEQIKEYEGADLNVEDNALHGDDASGDMGNGFTKYKPLI